MNKERLLKLLKEYFPVFDIRTYINDANGKHEIKDTNYNFIVGFNKNSGKETLWISNIDNIPYVILSVGEFYVYYGLGESIKNIEDETPSISQQSLLQEHGSSKHMGSLIKPSTMHNIVILFDYLYTKKYTNFSL